MLVKIVLTLDPADVIASSSSACRPRPHSDERDQPDEQRVFEKVLPFSVPRKLSQTILEPHHYLLRALSRAHRLCEIWPRVVAVRGLQVSKGNGCATAARGGAQSAETTRRHWCFRDRVAAVGRHAAHRLRGRNAAQS